ncbi:hypothetical protein G9F72_003060 [Clostridium estertheticum]|uniref:hypothetical protein n=1 Tax=Clostridium estertheticum TaxID=238834 RepID=UPI0013E93F63|nr:hypothetical protein [Clostridium estertheticum]MBZ9685329.1 hypothetical protein [Clostridium estertheticum]
MSNKKNCLLISLLILVFVFTSCSSGPKFITNQGELSQPKSDTMAVEYTIKSSKGFFVSLGFKLTEGKVDWEIINPKNETVFKGYMLYENGKVYRNGNLNEKEEVQSEVDDKGNKTDIRKVGYLQFDPGNIPGKYTLKLRPVNAEGSYEVIWSDKLLRK